MESFIRVIISMIFAILTFTLTHFIEKKLFTRCNVHSNYLNRSRRNNGIKFILYSLITLVSIFALFHIKKNDFSIYLKYVLIAFGIKGLYQLILCTSACVKTIIKKRKKNTNNLDADFAYCDDIIMLNLIGMVITGIIYAVMREQNILYPYSGITGNMLAIMVSLTFQVDLYSIYAEFEKRDEHTVFYKVNQRDWNIIDRIFLDFHCVKTYLIKLSKEPRIAMLCIVFTLVPVITFIANWNIQ